MPRNRSGGLAAVGASVRRSAASSYSSRQSGSLRRRAVVAVLALASLVLITVYFREAEGGVLHDTQSAGATALRPFEVGAERVARPFRDAYGWLAGLLNAKEENERLRDELEQLRQQAIQNATAARENQRLKALLDFSGGPEFPRGYTSVAASVLSHQPSRFDQQVVISVGSDHGIRKNDPVMTEEGLVGEVTKVTPETALVTLLTDPTSAVSAYDVVTDTHGVVRHGEGSDSLILDRVPKEEVVNRGDLIVTSGRRFRQLASIYPRFIPIGEVTSVGQTDIDVYQQVQVRAFVDFASLDAVLVLVSNGPQPRLP